MKTVFVHLDDKDHELLTEVKGERTWRQLLLAHIKDKKELKENGGTK